MIRQQQSQLPFYFQPLQKRRTLTERDTSRTTFRTTFIPPAGVRRPKRPRQDGLHRVRQALRRRRLVQGRPGYPRWSQYEVSCLNCFDIFLSVNFFFFFYDKAVFVHIRFWCDLSF